jgi:cyclopropane fatty-acyl-phospholipid synthase-like methyltransferase
MDVICDCVSQNSSVFDLGCGTGSMLAELIKKCGVKSVGGCEVSSHLLEAAQLAVLKTLGRPGSFIKSSRPPQNLRDFDCITLIDVLHHIPRKAHEEYLKEVSENMKPGAMLILKDIDASSPLVWFNRLHDAIFSGNGFQEIGHVAAVNLAVTAGLHVENTKKIRKLWYPHYFVLARKP